MDIRHVVRPARPQDGPQLAALNAISWPAEVEVAPAAPADQPFFDERHHVEDVLVAHPADAADLVGYVRLGRHLPIAANAHVVHIHALVVAEAARGRGVGAQLVAAAIAEAGRRGAIKVGLRTVSNNAAALRLYERLGFVEEGRLHAELLRPDGSYADDVWLARWSDSPGA